MAVYTTASHTWAVGETVTAANMNSQVRDLVNAFGGYTSYTPTWTSTGTAPALGNGTLTGSYSQIGKRVFFQLNLNAGSTTTFGTGSYIFSLPVSITGGLCTSSVFTHAGSVYLGEANVNTGSTFTILTQPAAGASAFMGATSPATWASGDSLIVVGTCQSV